MTGFPSKEVRSSAYEAHKAIFVEGYKADTDAGPATGQQRWAIVIDGRYPPEHDYANEDHARRECAALRVARARAIREGEA